MSRLVLYRWFSLVLVAGLLAVCSAGRALTINLNYLSPAVDSRSVSNPNDPSGQVLLAHMQAAAAEWTDIVRDTHTVEIDFFYGDSTTVPSETANANIGTVTNDFRKALTGDIIFYVDRDWYFDPTPQSDAEFAMSPTVLGDLQSAERAEGFRESPSGTPQLEVGYRGNTSDPMLIDKYDLLSTARHEIGHIMGVNSQIPVADTEFSDDDYDLPASLIGGHQVGVLVLGAGLNPPDIHVEHFQAAGPLMSGQGTGPGVRRGISETDVLAAATLSDWQQIDFPRKSFYAVDTNYSNPANWTGGRLPSLSDLASLRHGGAVSIAKDERAGSLFLSNGSTLNTGSFRFDAQTTVTIDHTVGAGDSGITVGNGGRLATRVIEINEGLLTIVGGEVSAGQGSIINREGVVQGFGSISVDDLFDSGGVLRGSGGTLVLDSALGGAQMDLDGEFNRGSLQALAGNIDINLGFKKADGESRERFEGTIEIGPGHFVEVDDSILLMPETFREPPGSLLLNGSSSQVAEFRGTELAISGLVSTTRRGVITAAARLLADGKVTALNSDDDLTINGAFEQEAGLIEGDGKIQVLSDYDGFGGTVTIDELNIGGDARFAGVEIRSASIDANKETTLSAGVLEFSEFHGEITQSGGRLDITRNVLGGSLLDGILLMSSQAELGVHIANEEDHSQLIVAEGGLIDGSINVELMGGFRPKEGQEFEVVLSDNLEFISPKLTGPNAGLFELFTSSKVVLLRTLASVTGDYNQDGMVNLADYTVWRDNLGSSASLPNDNDLGVKVGLAHYNLWKANFGTAAASASLTAAARVPEPTAYGLLLFAVLVGYFQHCHSLATDRQ